MESIKWMRGDTMIVGIILIYIGAVLNAPQCYFWICGIYIACRMIQIIDSILRYYNLKKKKEIISEFVDNIKKQEKE